MVDAVETKYTEVAHPTFAMAIYNKLKGQEVEIYCGNTSRVFRFCESDNSLLSIIHGIVTDVMGDCLVIECTIMGKGISNLLYLNAWAIESIMPIKPGVSINEFYLDDVSIQEHKRGLAR
jgi:hypothetical protein